MLADERRGVQGKVHDEGRPLQAALHEVLPQLFDVLAVRRDLLGHLHAHRRGERLQLVQRGLGRDRSARGIREGRVHRNAIPLSAEIELRTIGPRDRRRAGHGDRRVLDELLREVGDAVVVGVGLIGLEHRELGAVGGVGTLVAEVSVDLEHAVDAADDGALEEELGSDAKVQLGVERVRVRHEGPRRRPAVLHLQHRSLHLEEAVIGEGLAQRRIHLGARDDRLPRLIAGDEIEEARAHPALLAQLAVQVRQRQQRLRRDHPVGDHDRQLAAAAGDDLTGHRDVVAEVDEVLPGLQRLLAHFGERHHRLDAAAVAGLQRREAQLARIAAEHDASGDRRGDTGLGTGLEIGVARAQSGDGVGDRDGHRVGAARGIRPLGKQPLALGEAYRLLLVHVGEVRSLGVRGGRDGRGRGVRRLSHGAGLLGIDVPVYRGPPARPPAHRDPRGQPPRTSSISGDPSCSARSTAECTSAER